MSTPFFWRSMDGADPEPSGSMTADRTRPGRLAVSAIMSRLRPEGMMDCGRLN